MKPEKRSLYCWLYGLCAFIVGIMGLISFCEIIFLILYNETPFLRLSIPFYYVPFQSDYQIHNLMASVPVFAIIIIICIYWSMKLFNKARLYSIRAKELSVTELPPKKPYVLYLRSFDSQKDTSKILSFTSETEEEILVNTLSPIGKTVAIGCPQEKIQPLGGYRIYVANNEWKNTVIMLYNDAALTAIRVGDTEGLSWEIQQTLKNITDLQKLIFLIPDIQRINLSFFGNLEKEIRQERSKDVQITPCYFNKQGWGTVSSIIYFEKQDNDSVKQDNGSEKNYYIMKQSLVPRRTIWNHFGNLSPALQKAMFPVYEQFNELNFTKKFWNAISTYFFYILTAIIIVCLFLINLNQTDKLSITDFLFTKTFHDAEQIYPELADILAEQAQAYKTVYTFCAGHAGCLYLSDEHINEYIALDIPVFKKFHSETLNIGKDDLDLQGYKEICSASLTIENAIAQLPKQDAIKYNNFLIKSALMVLQIEKPECMAIYTPEEFKKKMPEALSSLTEEQYKTVNDLLSSVNEETVDDTYIRYIEFINSLPDKSIKAFLFRGFFIISDPANKQ